MCDGFIDCNGFFAEDESQNCENNVRESCQDWWSLGRREDGEYLVSLGLTGKIDGSHDGISFYFYSIKF